MKVKPEWLRRFKQEANGHIETAGPLLAQLDTIEPEADEKAGLLRQLFIKAHSIKGTASMLGLEKITEAAARLETLWGEAWLDPAHYTQADQQDSRQQLIELAELVEQVREL